MSSRKGVSMQRSSTMFLRAAVAAIGVIVLLLCIFLLPAINREWVNEYPGLTHLKYPFMFVLAAAAIPFFFALYQAMKLLGYIDHNQAFSQLSIKALEVIKYCAAVIGVLFTAAEPIWYYMAQSEDAPGLIVIGLILIGVSFTVATFAAVLQRLLQSAIAIKSENDLTV